MSERTNPGVIVRWFTLCLLLSLNITAASAKPLLQRIRISTISTDDLGDPEQSILARARSAVDRPFNMVLAGELIELIEAAQRE